MSSCLHTDDEQRGRQNAWLARHVGLTAETVNMLAKLVFSTRQHGAHCSADHTSSMADIVAQCEASRNAFLSTVLMTLISKNGVPKQGDQIVARSRSFLLASQEPDRKAARIRVSSKRDFPCVLLQPAGKTPSREQAQAKESEINNPSDRGEEVCELRQRVCFSERFLVSDAVTFATSDLLHRILQPGVTQQARGLYWYIVPECTLRVAPASVSLAGL